jgi:hypothetical protein
MGLAVMVMVLIGVMGAGLLVFVRNDLETVVEVNQGQRAFDVAEAGVQVAKQQILSSKTAGHYDTDGSSGCDSLEETPPPEGEDWSPGGGVSREFADGQFAVTVQWMNPDATAPDECRAPVTGTPSEGVDYFRVVSTGTYGNATRRVEAIYETYPLNVPRAYYTPGKIVLNGSKVCIDSVSLFSGDDIELTGSGGGCANGQKITGPDLAYGNWAEPPSDQFNTTPRIGPSCSKTLPDGTLVTKTCAGLGAVGRINSKRAGLDYDSLSTPGFVAEPTDPQGSGEITFPFDVNEQPDANRLCDIAKRQGNYTADPTTSGTTNFSTWPQDSSKNTVVCYEFTNTSSSHTLRWTVAGNQSLTGDYADCKGPIQEGTLVIRNGGFSIKSGSNVTLFRGVVVTRGPEEILTSEVGDAELTGNNCLDGFINSTGPITIAGSVTPSSSQMSNDRPGFYGADLWSWRELYG